MSTGSEKTLREAAEEACRSQHKGTSTRPRLSSAFSYLGAIHSLSSRRSPSNSPNQVARSRASSWMPYRGMQYWSTRDYCHGDSNGAQPSSSCRLNDGRENMWSTMSDAPNATLKGHSRLVSLVTFSPDGLRLASGSRDHTVRLWDAMSGMHIATLKGHSEWVTSVAFSPDGLRQASGSDDHTLRLWDAMSGAHIATLKGHSQKITSVAFSPNSLQLASGSDDCTLRLWDALSGAHIATLTGHSLSVTSISFPMDNHSLITRSGVETFTWDLTSDPPCCPDSGSLALGFPSTIGLSSLIWSTDGPWIRVQHPQDNQATRICYIPTLYTPSTTVQASSLPTQSRVAVGCADGRVIILNIQDHYFIRRLGQGATPPVESGKGSYTVLFRASFPFASCLLHALFHRGYGSGTPERQRG